VNETGRAQGRQKNETSREKAETGGEEKKTRSEISSRAWSSLETRDPGKEQTARVEEERREVQKGKGDSPPEGGKREEAEEGGRKKIDRLEIEAVEYKFL